MTDKEWLTSKLAKFRAKEEIEKLNNEIFTITEFKLNYGKSNLS